MTTERRFIVNTDTDDKSEAVPVNTFDWSGKERRQIKKFDQLVVYEQTDWWKKILIRFEKTVAAILA